jgi:sarcosine oxidase, subunit beta
MTLRGTRVIVVGAGIVGAAVAWSLTRAGARVTVLERAAAAATGATGRSAAGLRHQFSAPQNVRFSAYGARRYARFQDEVGADAGFRRVGYAFLVPACDDAAWRDQADTVRANGGRVELLAPAEAAARWPWLDLSGIGLVSYGPDDGVLDPHAVTLGWLAAARAGGATVRFEAEVTGLAPLGGGWRVRTAHGAPLTADVVVNAAGPQAGRVAALAGASVPVVPSRRSVYVTTPVSGLALPTPLTVDVETGVWLRSEGERVIFGRSNPAEPPGENERVDWDWLEPTLERALPRFPFLAHAGLDRRACWAGHYEVTPDHLPLIGWDAALPGLLHAAGFSGHGVQHAPATGAAVAALVAGDDAPFDLTPFAPDRFTDGRRALKGAEAAIV